MYSHADRIHAVELHIKAREAVRQRSESWVIPQEHSEELVPRVRAHRDLRVRSVARAPKFSEVQKQAALEHYRTHGHCISLTMRALCCPGRGALPA